MTEDTSSSNTKRNPSSKVAFVDEARVSRADSFMITESNINLLHSDDSLLDFIPSFHEFEGGHDEVEDEYLRLKWSSSVEFIASLSIFTINLDTVTKFSLLCLKYGGCIFIFLYLLLMVICMIPMYYLELLLGHYYRNGPISIWNKTPSFKGIGFCICIFCMSSLVVYNSLQVAWAILFLAQTFKSNLAWTSCDKQWNTDKCAYEDEIEALNETMKLSTNSPGTEHFRGRILGLWPCVYHDGTNYKELYNGTNTNAIFGFSTNSLGLGDPIVEISLVSLLTYIAVYCISSIGFRYYGRIFTVLIVTITIIQGVLLFRGVSLPGSHSAVAYAMRYDSSSWLKLELWIETVTLSLYSCNIGFGMHQILATHNSLNENILRDCIMAVVINFAISLLSGLFIFCLLGNLAFRFSTMVEKLIRTDRVTLLFEIVPDAIGRIPGSQFYSLLIYFMTSIISMGSMVSAIITTMESIQEEFYNFIGSSKIRTRLFKISLFFVSYCFSLEGASRGGIFYVSLFTSSTSAFPMLITLSVMTMVICYVWDFSELQNLTEQTVGVIIKRYMLFCWQYLIPAIFLTFAVLSLFPHPLNFNGYVIDEYYVKIHCIYSIVLAAIIPVYFISYLIINKGKSIRKYCLKSSELKRAKDHGTTNDSELRKFFARCYSRTSKTESVKPSSKTSEETTAVTAEKNPLPAEDD